MQKVEPTNKKPTEPGIEGEVIEEYKVGYGHPPKNRQFGQPEGNPGHSGSWRKEDTVRYKLEQMIKMTDDELKKIATDPTRPRFETKCAEVIHRGDWKELREIIHEVYGRPSQLAPEGTIQRPKEVEERVKIKAKGGK